MWAKVLSNVIITALSSLATWTYRKVTGYLERRKRDKQSQEAAKKVENAKTSDDFRSSVNDLP